VVAGREGIFARAWHDLAEVGTCRRISIDVAGKLEEITVTARQRLETQVSVPFSTQVFSDAKIRSAGIFDLNSLQYQRDQRAARELR
jgi:hypothetical protein